MVCGGADHLYTVAQDPYIIARNGNSASKSAHLLQDQAREPQTDADKGQGNSCVPTHAEKVYPRRNTASTGHFSAKHTENESTGAVIHRAAIERGQAWADRKKNGDKSIAKAALGIFDWYPSRHDGFLRKPHPQFSLSTAGPALGAGW